MKKLMMVAVILLTSVGSVMAQKEYKRGFLNHVGINVGAGTEGISVGLAAPVTSFFEVEAGVNVMPSFKLSGDLDVEYDRSSLPQVPGVEYPYPATIHVDGDFNRTTFNVKANLYPFGGGSKFFIAAGFSIGGEKIAEVTGSCDELREISQQLPTQDMKDQFHQVVVSTANANLGGYNLELDENYNVQGDIRCKKVRPYLGLGFGRLVPKNRLGMRLELGCQFMDKLKVYQNGNQIDIEQALMDAGEDDLSKFVKDLKIYPVVKFSFTGRIL